MHRILEGVNVMNEPFDLFGTQDEKGFVSPSEHTPSEEAAPAVPSDATANRSEMPTDETAMPQEMPPFAPEQPVVEAEAPQSASEPPYTAPQEPPHTTQTAYTPQYGSPNYTYTMPGYTRPSKKQPKPRKKRPALRLALVALCCALIGSVCGGLVVGLLMRSNETNDITPVGTEPTTVTNQSVRPVSANTEGLTPAEIYEANVSAIVSIYNEASGGYNIFGQSTTVASSGTGFIVSSDGEILTNYHVVEDAQTLTVTLYNGTEYSATVLGYESDNDVALIKINATDLPTVTLGESSTLAVGDEVVAIGNPLGELTNSLTVGYISAKERDVNTDGSPINMMQLDATINSGNSGGPLFDSCGNVVGIITAKYSGETGSGTTIEGIGFAIPIDDVTAILDDLRQHGSVLNRAYLGISGRSVEESEASTFGLPLGMIVSEVTSGSCAEQAGIRRSDIIIAINDETVESYEDLSKELKKFRAGDETTVTVYRSGQTIDLTVVFDAKPTESTVITTTEEEATQEDDWGFNGWGFDGWGSRP